MNHRKANQVEASPTVPSPFAEPNTIVPYHDLTDAKKEIVLYGPMEKRHVFCVPKNKSHGARCGGGAPRAVPQRSEDCLNTAYMPRTGAPQQRKAYSASKSMVSPSMMVFTVRMAHILPHMVHVPSFEGGALSK